MSCDDFFWFCMACAQRWRSWGGSYRGRISVEVQCARKHRLDIILRRMIKLYRKVCQLSQTKLYCLSITIIRRPWCPVPFRLVSTTGCILQGIYLLNCSLQPITTSSRREESRPLGPVSYHLNAISPRTSTNNHQVVRRVTRNDKITRSIRVVGIIFFVFLGRSGYSYASWRAFWRIFGGKV